MLKISVIKLELISEINKYYFVEKGLRGGIFCISKIFSEANNKYMKNYDSTKEYKYIMDANLYGCAMSQYLLCGKFKQVKNADSFAVDLISKSSLYGYTLELDLEYPDELHNTIIIHLLQKNLNLLTFCLIIATKLLTKTMYKWLI